MHRTRTRTFLGALFLAIACTIDTTGQQPPHNVILFVPDGLRSRVVTAQAAPALARLAADGVYFANSHSVFPTFTMPNATALATGHFGGDTGVLGNAFFVGRPIAASGGSLAPMIENDRVLGELDEQFGGNFLTEITFLEAARRAGFSTVAIGKHGPTLLQDHTARDGAATIVIDDATGGQAGVPLAADVAAAIEKAGLPTRPPARGENARPRTTVANVVQQDWMVDVAGRVVLPMLKARGRPFAMVFWSRDPDVSQHNHGDGDGALEPGINGPTTMAAIRNADDNLRRLREALATHGLDATTNIIVAADHGFATISKESATSPAARRTHEGVPEGQLPPGFLAADLADALALPLWNPGREVARVPAGGHTRGSGLLGADPAAPDVIVVANGGADLLYLPTGRASALAPRIVAALMAQDYVSGIFVDDRFGAIDGTLPLSAVNLAGGSAFPRPAMVVNFRSYSSGCAVETTCGVTVTDVTLAQGQGFHGSFGRGETFNFMAAIGPDFRAGFVDPMPVGNTDVAPTIARILGLTLPSRGALQGRVMEEALKDGRTSMVRSHIRRSAPGLAGLRTIVEYQEAGGTLYFDAGGFPGRTLGLRSER